MASLLTLLADGARAGVYRTAMDAEELVAAGKTVGLEVLRLGLGGARGKYGLLDRFAKTLRFPAHFGRNWDALNDCLCDLDWLGAKGLLLIVTGANDFVAADEEDFQTAVEILESAGEFWRARKKPFWVLIQAQGELALRLPQIVAD
jgi:RNAse (barnase) inhibitor barstar